MDDTLLKEKRNWPYTLAKVTFCIAAVVLVMLTVLANMGGNTEEHKASVEGFVKDATGYEARIKTLNKLSYFPSVTVDFEDLDLFAKTNAARVLAHVDRVLTSVSFWDVARQNGRFRLLNVLGASARPGVFLDKEIALKYFSVLDNGEDGATLKGEGKIGNVPLNFTMGMASYGTGKTKNYSFTAERSIDIAFGDVKMTGQVRNATNPAISIQDLKIAQSGKDVITGHIDLSNRRATEVMIGGEIHVGQSVMKPDLLFDRKTGRFSGVLKTENFNETDFAYGSAFDGLVNLLVQYLGDLKKDAKKLDTFFESQGILLDVNGEKKQLKFVDNTLSIK